MSLKKKKKTLKFTYAAKTQQNIVLKLSKKKICGQRLTHTTTQRHL